MPGRRKNPKEEGPRSSHSGRGGIGALKIQDKDQGSARPEGVGHSRRVEPLATCVGPFRPDAGKDRRRHCHINLRTESLPLSSRPYD
jgi:hypothetical protein